MLRRALVGAVLAALVAAGAASSATASPPADPGKACDGISSPTTNKRDQSPVSAELLRRCLRLNQIQALGTHNSYKGPIPPELLAGIGATMPQLAEELDYSHPPLLEQFTDQGIRQIELDVFADPVGGHYSDRIGLDLVGLPNIPPPELFEPGYKVLHIQDLDFNSTCLTLVACLEQVRDWSNTNPGHLPIAVLIELKTASIGPPFTVPVPIGAAELDTLDAEIRSVFPSEHMITPDDVRGDYPTLNDAVRAGNWPTLQDAAGKVLFLMDNGGALRTAYLAGAPSLEGRVLFTNSVPGADDAAFVKMNNPSNVAAIQQLVADGYVVRTRADTPTSQARTNDTTMRDNALASAAQWVSTDYPVPGSSPFSPYFASIPDGHPARCNPVNTGPRCDNRLLERATGSSRAQP